jgi:hypothetical protein
MPCVRRKRRRLQASFRRMDHCIFWRLGFRQFSFRHVARVPQCIAPYAWTRPLVGCHAAVPSTFRRQVRHQTQKHPNQVPPCYTGNTVKRLAAHHAIVPFRFPVQVSHQTQEPPFEFLPSEPGIYQSASRRRCGRTGRSALGRRCITYGSAAGALDHSRERPGGELCEVRLITARRPAVISAAGA